MNKEQIKCECGEVLDWTVREYGSPMMDDYPRMKDALFFKYYCKNCNRNHERHFLSNEEGKNNTEIDYVLTNNNYVRYEEKRFNKPSAEIFSYPKPGKQLMTEKDLAILFVFLFIGFILGMMAR